MNIWRGSQIAFGGLKKPAFHGLWGIWSMSQNMSQGPYIPLATMLIAHP